MKQKSAKIPPPAYILLAIALGGSLAVIALNGLLQALLYEPLQTAETYCLTHPCLKVGSLVISQPSSSFFVFLLAVITIWTGALFLKTANNQLSRFWWGLFLIMLGTGSALAGTSYQAFEFEIKCRGFEYCLWTSWWELSYMIFTVAALGAAFIGVAHAVLPESSRRNWTIFALINTFAYVFIVLAGMLTANRLLLSFELMVIFAFAGFLIITLQSLSYYRRNKNPLIIKIVLFGAILALVVVVYFIALISGFADVLWAKGIWFNANDVLHILMIGWVLYGYRTLATALKDEK